MRFSTVAAGLAVAGSAIAAPAHVAKRAAITDVDILQFALTLEHLENVFYHGALDQFTAADFEAAGYSADYYNNIMYISFDEQTHVTALEAAIKGLGATPVKACKYSFPYTDVPTFVYLSHALESTGVSAYLGAAALISSDYYLTVAGSILSVEALHTSYQRAALGAVPMASPFETPLGANLVFTVASQFIVSCPPKNPKLPFVAFPTLTYDGAPATCEEPDCSAPDVYIKKRGYAAPAVPPVVGDTVTFTSEVHIPAGSYLTFINSLAIASVAGDIKGKTISAAIPDAVIGGFSYAIITSEDITGDFSDYTDSAVIAGPAEFEVKPAAPAIDDSIV